jgi:hypothetical protein
MFSKERVKNLIDFEKLDMKLSRIDIKSNVDQEMSNEAFVDESDDCDNFFEANESDYEAIVNLSNSLESNATIESLTENQKKLLIHIMKSMSHKMKMKIPWWRKESDSKIQLYLKNSTSNQIKVVHDATEEQTNFRNVMNEIIFMSPKFSSLIHKKPHDDVGYHILAILFGYIVMMRSYNCETSDAIYDAIELLYQSTPAFQSSFQSSSIADMIQLCLQSQYLSTQSRNKLSNRKYIRLLLQDLLLIISHSYTICYALLELFFMIQSCLSTENDSIDLESLFFGNIFTVNSILPTILSYQSIFQSKPNQNRHISYQRNFNHNHEIIFDRMCRKIYFMMLFCFDQIDETGQSSFIKSLEITLSNYIDEYLAID